MLEYDKNAAMRFVKNTAGYYILKDTENNVLQISKPFMRLFGYATQEEMVGDSKNLSRFNKATNLERLHGRDMQACQDLATKTFIETNQLPDGIKFYEKIKFVPIFDPSSQEVAYILQIITPFLDLETIRNSVFMRDADYSYFYPTPLSSEIINKQFFGITCREAECLHYLIHGKSSSQISELLNRSVRTIEAHVQKLKIKFSCKNKVALLQKAIDSGFNNIIPDNLLETALIRNFSQSFSSQSTSSNKFSQASNLDIHIHDKRSELSVFSKTEATEIIKNSDGYSIVKDKNGVILQASHALLDLYDCQCVNDLIKLTETDRNLNCSFNEDQTPLRILLAFDKRRTMTFLEKATLKDGTVIRAKTKYVPIIDADTLDFEYIIQIITPFLNLESIRLSTYLKRAAHNYFEPSPLDADVIKSQFKELTVREAECLYYITNGCSAPKAGEILNRSPRTIEATITKLKAKFSCDSKTQLIEKSIQIGFMNIIPKSLLDSAVES